MGAHIGGNGTLAPALDLKVMTSCPVLSQNVHSRLLALALPKLGSLSMRTRQAQGLPILILLHAMAGSSVIANTLV